LKRKAVFTGGGSAGHVSVNTAIIPEFLKHSWEVTYIGSEKGIEKSIIEKEFPEVTYKTVSVGKLRRYLSFENLKDPFKVLKGIFEARRILKTEKPDFVFSKGGFVSVPVVIAARTLSIPIFIHESDYTLGLANKIAIPFSNKIFTTFKETASQFPEDKSLYIGAVLREGIFKGDGEKGKRLCGFLDDKPVMFIMGGSLGAVKINNVITENLTDLLENYNVIHLCGKGNVRRALIRKGYYAVEYVHEELFDLLAAANVIVSRAGSNSIFEFLGLQKPMLLIPLSAQASRGDQILNAKSFAEQGFCKVIMEEKLNYANFGIAVRDLIHNSGKYQEMMAKERPFKTASEMFALLIDVWESTNKKSR
jgi:UDP-N-acetylglucosamine--N-acetylmuramyl-(pentapeptide) pyrophosphoryl-undecaprenol N-acetylglucosamine transferase